MAVFKRYHISTGSAPSRRPWARVRVIRDLQRCLNCGTCIDSCLYGVHDRRAEDTRFLAEPTHELCRVCFRCVGECPVGALSLERNAEFLEAGNGLFKPEILRTISNEAEAGRIPVTGACYRGPFGGPGFDGIWTDMSEIVRPTRDGIHGREYISTSVDIGFRPTALDFSGDLPSAPPREVPLPLVFDAASSGLPPMGILRAITAAAKALQTYAIVPARAATDAIQGMMDSVLVRLDTPAVAPVPSAAGVEVTYSPEDGFDARSLRKANRGSIVSLRVPLSAYRRDAVDIALDAALDMIHFTCDWTEVNDIAGVNRYIEALRDLHRYLIDLAQRDAITVLASGPIAGAEHVPKTIILGADLVGVDLALYAVLECVPPNHALHLGRFPEEFSPADVEWGTQRILNLSNAWRDQLLEILGAMGMREVRRLRGETGRAIFQAEAEREAFADIKVREVVRR